MQDVITEFLLEMDWIMLYNSSTSVTSTSVWI